MIKAKIVRKGNSLGKMKANVKKIDKQNVKVGYFPEQGLHNSGLPYATLMAIQEFGTDTVPSRPIFQITASTRPPQREPKVKEAVKEWSKLLTTKDNSKDLLDTIGKNYQGALVGLFGDSSVLSPNADTTIRLKGRDEPLVDSGELRDNLTYKSSIGGESKK